MYQNVTVRNLGDKAEHPLKLPKTRGKEAEDIYVLLSIRHGLKDAHLGNNCLAFLACHIHWPMVLPLTRKKEFSDTQSHRCLQSRTPLEGREMRARVTGVYRVEPLWRGER